MWVPSLPSPTTCVLWSPRPTSTACAVRTVRTDLLVVVPRPQLSPVDREKIMLTRCVSRHSAIDRVSLPRLAGHHQRAREATMSAILRPAYLPYRTARSGDEFGSWLGSTPVQPRHRLSCPLPFRISETPRSLAAHSILYKWVFKEMQTLHDRRRESRLGNATFDNRTPCEDSKCDSPF